MLAQHGFDLRRVDVDAAGDDHVLHPIDPAEALRIGLVNHVVPAAELLPTATALARKIVENGPVAVRKIKETVVRSASVSLEEGPAIMDASARVVMQTEDAREGPRAFLEKRQPRYVGR
ncbi:MAG: enoyl-CoA hydratase/isomerase family protein [Myxococcota bacterium]